MFILIILLSIVNIYAEPALRWLSGASKYEFSVYFQPELFYGKNLHWLNNAASDEVLYGRHYFDLQTQYTYGEDILKARAVVRERTLWGNTPGTIFTTQSSVKENGVVFGSHRHGLSLSDFWIRELWLEACLSDLLCLPFCNRHTLTMGAFFFELGRGISLGAAYLALPFFVAIDIDTALDQYAFGAKLSGELIPGHLWYDFYSAIFKDREFPFGETEIFERGHQFGHCFTNAHKCRTCSFAYAGRLRWEPLTKSDDKKFYFEPYWLVCHTPELKIEFSDDGISTLGTLGIAGECTFNSLEWGFDLAFNIGGQDVFGIDRNKLVMQDNAGTLQIVNDQVVDTRTDQDVLATPAHEKVIYSTGKSESLNNQPLSPTLKNKEFRFQNPFSVRYKGFFFVTDMSYVFIKDIFKVSCTWGYATGGTDAHKRILEENPQAPCKESVNYDGFISVNETYVGKRVISALFLNGPGMFPRPSTFGSLVDSAATLISGFTNIVLTGFSADYQYKLELHRWHINPNVLFFWQEHPLEFKGRPVPSYLGVELNCVSEVQIVQDLTFFLVGAFFIPGACYKHLKGVPLTADQISAQREKEVCPLLGTDPSLLINFGFRYTF